MQLQCLMIIYIILILIPLQFLCFCTYCIAYKLVWNLVILCSNRQHLNYEFYNSTLVTPKASVLPCIKKKPETRFVNKLWARLVYKIGDYFPVFGSPLWAYYPYWDTIEFAMNGNTVQVQYCKKSFNLWRSIAVTY